MVVIVHRIMAVSVLPRWGKLEQPVGKGKKQGSLTFCLCEKRMVKPEIPVVTSHLTSATNLEIVLQPPPNTLDLGLM